MRKLCLKIHRWLALPLGVVMTVLCFSGLALLLFKDLAPLFDMNAKEIPLYTDIVRLHRWLFMKPGECTRWWTIVRTNSNGSDVHVYGTCIALWRCRHGGLRVRKH